MHEIIDMHSKYDNMHKNEMFYALVCINNYIISCINCMLSASEARESNIHHLSYPKKFKKLKVHK